MSESRDVQQLQEQLAPPLRRRSDIAAAYLLGSALHGRLRPDSDIDVALLPAAEGAIRLPARMALAAELGENLGRTVDLGIISSANLVYAAEAILGGRRIVTIDAEYVMAMETRLLGGYLQLKQDRREVEAAYRVA